MVKSAEKTQQKKFSLKKIKGKKTVIISVCLVVAVGIGAFFLWPKENTAEITYKNVNVEKRDISVVLTGTGTLMPADSYEVTSLVKGEILDAPFEEGDIIEKDQLLFKIDTTDMENSIEKQLLNVEKAQMNYNDMIESQQNLNVSSTADGIIKTLYVEVGDNVMSGGKIADVKDSSYMLLTVPFNSSDAENIHSGMSASVTLSDSLETLSGTVEKVGGTENVLAGNRLTRDITIKVKNPGALTTESYASAKVGNFACNSGAYFQYNAEKTVSAKTSGEVKKIYLDEGDAVKEGETIVLLEGDNSETQLKSSAMSVTDAELSLQNIYDQMENYSIKSPISGTVITKNYKTGDKIDSTTSTKAMAVIYDLSTLTFDMSIDELDIGSVKVGQKVTIVPDALEGQEFEGTISKVSIAGTSQNGVTSYPVTIVIPEPGELLPGMNVSASIVVSSATDALSIPVSAVSRGNTVLVSEDSETAKTYLAQSTTSSDKTAQNTTSNDKTTQKLGGDTPKGFIRVPVTLGVNDDDYIEVLSGLSEGDVIAVVEIKISNSQKTNTQMGGMTMGGGMSGGGMPSGGMPSGGMPSGGMPSGGPGGGF